MASGATDYQANLILSKDFGSNIYIEPTVWYIALSTTEVLPNSTGLTEPTDPAYTRVAVDNNNTNFEALTIGTGRQNAVSIEFPAATVSQGTITYVALCDAVTGGNTAYFSQLINNKVVGIGDVLRFDSGNLQIRLLPTA